MSGLQGKKKQSDVFKTGMVTNLKDYLKQKIAEAKLLQELKANNEILVKDKEETQFRYKLPDHPNKDGDSLKTLRSFYSHEKGQIDVQSNF